MSEIVYTRSAPEPIGPYSQAIRSGAELFCSGQIPLDPATGTIVGGDVAAQARQAFANLGNVLEAGGYSLGDVVKTTLFLIDMNDFAAVNAVYETFFGSVKPARSTVAVAALPKGARVEIDCIAKK